MVYEIRIKGYIRTHWFETFEHVKEAGNTTVLRGDFKDQAALYGVLRRVQELGMELVSVVPVAHKT